jgi:hypothetical protein
MENKCEACVELFDDEGILFDLLFEKLKKNNKSATEQDLIKLYHNNEHSLFSTRITWPT